MKCTFSVTYDCMCGGCCLAVCDCAECFGVVLLGNFLVFPPTMHLQQKTPYLSLSPLRQLLCAARTVFTSQVCF
eukprot:m.17881 g.17881  ORF g.17881 m.17881 type:complete len:74 (+) comp7605_c0_seq2:1828-2049(+)